MTKSKSLKPIEHDVHLKYRCDNCGQDHWISLKEAQTKGFKIVCDCDKVLKLRLVNKCKILFQKKKPQIPVLLNADTISGDILKKATKILVGYGFSKDESESLIKKAYLLKSTNDTFELIKKSLELHIGENNG